MKLRLVAAFVLAFSLLAKAGTTTVAGTIQDPSGQVFANGTYRIEFRPVPGNTGPYSVGGADFQRVFIGGLDASGAFSVVLTSNNTITPAGSTWQFTMCPDATAACPGMSLAVSGTTQNISSAFNAGVPLIRVNPTLQPPWPRAYGDSEVFGPIKGSGYYRTSTDSVRAYNGTAWFDLGGGGGGGGVTTFSAGNLPPVFTSNVTNPTTTPSLAFTLSSAAAHTYLGNATGSLAPPTYNQLDFTQLAGALSCAQLPQFTGGNVTSASAGTCTLNGAGGGAVSSVGLAAPGTFTVTGSPVTTSGTLTFAWNVNAADKLPVSTAVNTVSFVPVPSCGDNTHPLVYDTVSHSFGCQVIPYSVSGFYNGTIPNSYVLSRHVLAQPVTFPANLAGSQFVAETAATAQTVFIIQKCTPSCSQVATITVAAAGTTGTFSTQAGVAFTAGQFIKLIAPASSDATLANIAFNLRANRD